MTSERKRKRGLVDVESPRNAKAIKKPEFETPNSKVEKPDSDAKSTGPKKQTQVAVLKEEEKPSVVKVPESPVTTNGTPVQDKEAIQKPQSRKEKKAEKAKQTQGAVQDNEVIQKQERRKEKKVEKAKQTQVAVVKQEEKKPSTAKVPESPKNQVATSGTPVQDKAVIQKQQGRRATKAENAARKQMSVTAAKPRWKLSEPTGGRILNIDPVFAGKEEFVIVAHRLSLQVYSTSTSILVRSIPLVVSKANQTSTRIVAYCMSPSDSAFCWVACSDGAVFRVDWATGAGATEYWTTSSTGVIYMTAAIMESMGRKRDVLFTTEARKEGGYRITAHELTQPGAAIATAVRTIFTTSQQIHTMKTLVKGEIIVAAAENKILIGTIRSLDFDTIDKIKYEFRTFEVADRIASLDARIGQKEASTNNEHATPSKKTSATSNILDMVVGDVKGVTFVYYDILGSLIRLRQGGNPGAQSILPRKLHWHRKAVSSVKWSLDGNYLISGGSETTLVIWQLDTGHKQFLPHLSAAIKNIVVSPRGNSYAVHLADNSTMVLSTSELTPTANFAGIQAPVIEMTKNFDSYVKRVDDAQKSSAISLNTTPAVINSSNPSQLLLAVGEALEFGPDFGAVESAPYLQTFDVVKSQHITRQALARTNITNKNMTPGERRLVEPKTTHMQISHDGSWLATVDEWQRPNSDLDLFSEDPAVAEFFKLEVYLKFWQWNSTEQIWELVSRVDAPHTNKNGSSAVGRVLDLAADPSSLKFSTIGEDGLIRVWCPKTRMRDNVIVRGKDGNPARTWSCRNSIALQLNEVDAESIFEDSVKPTVEPTACLAYSEDGSVLAAAVGGDSASSVYLINAPTGSIRSRPGNFGGDIVRMAILHKYLIVISDNLNVYDMVEGELAYGFVVSKTMSSLSRKQKQAMVHLAVDRTNQTFAVAIPRMKSTNPNKKEPINFHWAGTTEIDIFDPSNPNPLFTTSLPAMITTLLPTTSSPGYTILDTFAEIRTISPKATQTILPKVKQLQVDKPVPEEPPAADIMELAEEDDVLEDERIIAATRDIDEEDVEFPVVTQQQLTEVFDIGPAFALPPIEEMFYHVADLFAPKIIPQVVA